MNEEINEAEFKGWVSKINRRKGGRKLTENQLTRMFMEVDSNQDKAISKAEFKLYVKRML